MMIKKLLLLVICCFFIQSSISSLVKKDSTHFKFDMDMEAKMMYQLLLPNNNLEFIADEVTNEFGQTQHKQNNMLTDAPLYHGAFYGLIKTKTSFKNKYSFLLDLMVEDRGISYGINDVNKFMVYPIYQFQLNEKIRIFSDSLKIAIAAGSFMNNRLHQGLKIYNIDTQGSDISLQWKNLSLQFHKVGDLSYGVGLALEELTDYSLVYNLKFTDNKWLKFGANYNVNEYSWNYSNIKYDFFNNDPYNCYGVFGEYHATKHTKYYFQYEVRDTKNANYFERSGFVLGSKHEMKKSKVTAMLNAEFRYYGWLYNFRHKEDSVFYRAKNGNSIVVNRPNTVGDYLYPLTNFDNPYSQWAVYTDYQYQNIAGAEIRADVNWEFIKHWNAKINFESCSFIKEFETFGSNLFNYYFYTFSLVYQPAKEIAISLNLSNKMMNLDRYYQTFYMANEPKFGFTISKKLNN